MYRIIILLLIINYVLCEKSYEGIATEYGINEDNGNEEVPDLNAGACSDNDKRIQLYDPIVAVGNDIKEKYGCGTEIEIINKCKKCNNNGYNKSIKVIIYDECPECNNKNGERIDLPAYNWNKLYNDVVYIKDKKPEDDLGELPISWKITGYKVNVKNSSDVNNYFSKNKVEKKWWK